MIAYISYLLECGATSITKYPAIKEFGSELSQEFETQCANAGRKFIGTLTNLSGINIRKEVDSLYVDADLKKEIEIKLKKYMNRMMEN